MYASKVRLPVHDNTRYYSKVYDPDKDQAISYPSQYSRSKEESGDDWEARSSNNDSLPTNEEAIDESEEVRIHTARGKVVVSEGEEAIKMGSNEKKRQHRDLELIEPLSIDDENLSKLPKIHCMEYYEDTLDRQVCLCAMIKYPEIENLMI